MRVTNPTSSSVQNLAVVKEGDSKQGGTRPTSQLAGRMDMDASVFEVAR